MCSKTGTFDETVEITDLEHWSWLGPCLQARIGNRHVGRSWGRQQTAGLPSHGEGEPVMLETQAEWSRALQAAFQDLGVPADNVPHLYRLRHGGASHDVAYRLRGLPAVQKRGAWKTTTSVARYSKPARLNEQIKAMPAPVVKELERRERELKTSLHVWLSKQR